MEHDQLSLVLDVDERSPYELLKLKQHDVARVKATVLSLTLAAVFLASCAGPVGATNGMVWVANLSRTDASVHWQSPGLLGTPLFGGSGTEPLRACEEYGRGFAPGEHHITITTASASTSFVLTAPSEGQKVVWYQISPDGSITSMTGAEAPPSPYCP